MDEQSLKMTLTELSYIAGRAGFSVRDGGVVARVDTLMKWATDFENKHRDTDWEEKVWDDEVWFFFAGLVQEDNGARYACAHDVSGFLPPLSR